MWVRLPLHLPDLCRRYHAAKRGWYKVNSGTPSTVKIPDAVVQSHHLLHLIEVTMMTKSEAFEMFSSWYNECIESGIEPEEIVEMMGEMKLVTYIEEDTGC